MKNRLQNQYDVYTVDSVRKMPIGASDFIVKPFKPKELNDKVARHIRIAQELRLIKEENKALFK